MTNVDIVATFLDAVRDVTDKKLEGITLDTRIADLGLDSIQLMETIGVLEERLQLRFDDGALNRLTTVQDLSMLVDRARMGTGWGRC
jgi:acyl carrier protein